HQEANSSQEVQQYLTKLQAYSCDTRNRLPERSLGWTGPMIEYLSAICQRLQLKTSSGRSGDCNG
ncbi:MAG: hypothetical protein ACKPKO_25415, partial [Candidatus Fonsibacter sp.]